MSDQPRYPSYPGPEQPSTPSADQPPPPPGYQPPPPPGYQPPAGGQPPSYGQAPPPSYGQAPPPGYPSPSSGAPTGSYASWWSRVGAYLLDTVIGIAVSLPVIIAGFVVLGATATETTNVDGTTSLTGESPVGYLLLAAGYLVAIVFALWNYVFRQGRTGQTLGKKIVGISVVVESTGQPTGAGVAFGRMLLISILSFFTCYLNLLWPLWDDKKQALHDKVVSTLVVTAS